MNRAGTFWAQLSPEDRGALGIMAGFGTPQLGICAARGGGFDGLGDLVNAVEVGPVALGVACGVAIVGGLVAFARGRGAIGAYRVATGHSHGAGTALLRHEGSHVHAATSQGVRIVSATVSSDSGLVTLHRADVARMTPRQYMAFMYAGQAASGSTGCSSDLANVRAEHKRMGSGGMSPAQIRQIDRQAKADARSYARSPMVDRYANQLGRRGKL